ncbi:MAG: glycosyl hydrolase [Bacteroidetes bacterium]|nr:MAG: glycosyl hydrolase [Bacteroidota bacterium]
MRHYRFLFFFLLFFLISGYRTTAQAPTQACEQWVDSVMNELSVKEKIAQLIFIRTYSNRDKKYYKGISKIIKKHHIGGLCFFQGGPARQAHLTNHWQAMSKVPLLIALDAEWGLGMRLDSTISYPKQMTMGAIPNDSLIYQMGCDIAEQLKMIGTHINFAPVADINSNPANPVINTRSFGENREKVAQKSIMYMKGLQDHQIIATAKHFPGHGDTDTDSHYTLPLLNHHKRRMDSLELYPFKQMIKAGLGGIMTAHLYIPLYEKRANRASTLSHNIVSKLMTDSLGFNGLKVTDALDMNGVTKYFKPGETEREAYLAGNDILLLSLDVPQAIKLIKKEIKQDKEALAELDRRCRKVLTAKYRAGLHRYTPTKPAEVTAKVNAPSYQPLIREIYQSSITLLKDPDHLIPLKTTEAGKTAYLQISDLPNTPLEQLIARYLPVDPYQTTLTPNPAHWDSLLKTLSSYQTILISIHTSGQKMGTGYGITPQLQKRLQQLKEKHRLIVTYVGSPYGLMHFQQIPADALLLSYEDNATANDLWVQAIFGASPITGVLPVSINDSLKEGFGLQRKAINTLRYGCLEEEGSYQEILRPIDSLIHKAIKEKGLPGCQLWVAKDGNVIIDKTYGYQTYQKKQPIGDEEIYDVASITKVAATTLAVMKLYEEGLMDIDQRLSNYLPDLRESDKRELIIRDIMAHQGRFQAWRPFHKNTLDPDGLPSPEFYTTQPDPTHSIFINDHLFLDNNFPLVIYDSIKASTLRPTNAYKYSDLGFILLHRAIEQVTNKPLEEYVQQMFYEPLGLHHIGYHPLSWYHKEHIVPSEKEEGFRNGIIRGTVHDPNAALLGGVSGHAGLFSNAHDLGVLMQCLIQYGNYAGIQVLDSATVREFTTCQFPLNKNRRGIGFDKPLLNFYEGKAVCKGASPSSFGHSGFTGTYFWGDPEKKLVYVFLSNRTYPDSNNDLIVRENLRTDIHQILYEKL